MPRSHFGLAIISTALVAISVLPTFSQEKPVQEGLMNQKELSLNLALEIAQGAVEEGHARNQAVTVVVVDTSGIGKVLLRGDDAGPQTADVTRRKAYTALSFKGSSADQAKIWEGQKLPNITADRVALGGGLVIKASNEIVGAIGVSGGGTEIEEACGKAGIAKAADKLK